MLSDHSCKHHEVELVGIFLEGGAWGLSGYGVLFDVWSHQHPQSYKRTLKMPLTVDDHPRLAI